MSKQTKPIENRSRKTGQWTYVKLKDGRNIASPVSGGKISKTEIRDAVRVVNEEKLLIKTG